jgi:hypothetical protein
MLALTALSWNNVVSEANRRKSTAIALHVPGEIVTTIVMSDSRIGAPECLKLLMGGKIKSINNLINGA